MASAPILNGNGGVYIGAWTNWSHGAVHGATITLTRRDGALLIAFLGFYVGLAGSSFWRIACFAVHQMLSSDGVEDGLYHQRQAILRNSATDIVGLWHSLQANWFWRHKADTSFKRMLPLVAFCIFNVALFGVAGVFSSQVSSAAGNEVLVSSPNCGRLNTWRINTTTDFYKWFAPYRFETTFLGASYARQCYQGNANAGSCKSFVRPNISTIASTAACPFDGICVESGDKALVLDTRRINSHFDLGLNAAPKDRLTVRKVTTCAPITTVGYSKSFHPTNSTADDYIEYYYGLHNPEMPAGTPYSYRYPSHLETDYSKVFLNMLDYTIQVIGRHGDIPYIDPIPQLNRSDADVNLFLLSANNIIYTEPVEDPWYSAHLSPDISFGTGTLKGSLSAWLRDNPVSVLGCAEQYQFCNPNLSVNKSCTSLTGLDRALDMTDGLWQSSAQNVSFYSIGFALTRQTAMLSTIVSALGLSSLTARDSLLTGVQGPLPNNQWQLEVQYWHSICMALLQRLVVEQATGPPSETLYRWLIKPQTKKEQAQCHNQKIVNTAHTNFSILGLSIIVIVGELLLLTSFIIDQVVGYIQKRRNPKSYKRLEWSINQTFQLQRLAHEELGCGTWNYAADSIPTTRRGEMLALIDTSNPDHPVLVTPAPAGHASVQERSQSPIKALPASQSTSSNDDTFYPLQANSASTLQADNATRGRYAISPSSSRDGVDASGIAEPREVSDISSVFTEDYSPPSPESSAPQTPAQGSESCRRNFSFESTRY